MAKRQLRCLLGPMNGRHVWIDEQEHYYEFAVFPSMELSQAFDFKTAGMPLSAVVEREIYVVKEIGWKGDKIPVLVPSRYGEKELDAALVESLFR